MKRSWAKFVSVAALSFIVFLGAGWRYVNFDAQVVTTSQIQNDPVATAITVKSPLSITPATGASSFTIKGGEGYNGILYLYADEGDDAPDKWTATARTDGELQLAINAAIKHRFGNGSLMLTNAAAGTTLSILGGEGSAATIQLYPDEADDNADKWTITGTASDEVQFANNAAIKVRVNDGAIIVTNSAAAAVTVIGGEGAAATLNLYADDSDDAADRFSLVSTTANNLDVQNNASTVLRVSSAGRVTAPMYQVVPQYITAVGITTQTITSSMVIYNCASIATNYLAAPSTNALISVLNVGSSAVYWLDGGNCELSGNLTIGANDSFMVTAAAGKFYQTSALVNN